MAPEQARGGEVGPQADVWGLGAVLFEASTGRRPFAHREDSYEQLGRPAEPVGRHRRLPRELEDAIDSCLAAAPGERPSVDALREALDEA
jgi:serine/threonine protein kinase